MRPTSGILRWSLPGSVTSNIDSIGIFADQICSAVFKALGDLTGSFLKRITIPFGKRKRAWFRACTG
jgi:hypothetical protein